MKHCDFRCDFDPLFHRFRCDFGCHLAGALRFQIVAISNRCASNLQFGHLGLGYSSAPLPTIQSETRLAYAIVREPHAGRGAAFCPILNVLKSQSFCDVQVRIRSQPKIVAVSTCRSTLVAQCSATPATVAATPPCSATPFQTTKFRCDTSRDMGGRRCDTKIFRGCSATPVPHLQNAIKSRKSAATRVARHV